MRNKILHKKCAVESFLQIVQSFVNSAFAVLMLALFYLNELFNLSGHVVEFIAAQAVPIIQTA